MVKLGVPSHNLQLLLDEKATHTNIKDAIQKTLSKAPTGSTFIFYYAGHGINDKAGICFANYDMYSNGTQSNGFNINFISQEINANFKGDKVLLLADCCYSGGLINEAETIATKGKKVIAYSSATSSNTSTENWTFTQTIIDCFSGLPLADSDNDGNISAKDISNELYNAMKYRENQLCGYVFKNIDSTFTFAKSIEKKPTSTSKFKIGEYSHALQNEKWKPARIQAYTDNKYTVEFYDYSDKSVATLTENNLKPISFISYSIDEQVVAEWDKKEYPAKILQSKDDFYLISYDGYGSEWNEWLTYTRLRKPNEKTVQVEYQGKWYPAQVLKKENNKYFITYKGYNSSWDEWVGEERIRK